MSKKEKEIEVASMGRHAGAKYIGVSVRTLDGLFANGELKRLKLGTKTLVLKSDLDRLLDKLANGESVQSTDSSKGGN